MIPAYITFIVDNNRNDADTNIADDIEMSSINASNTDDAYLRHYDNDLNLIHQNIITSVMHDVIKNLDHDDDDDDTMETMIRTPAYNESSRIMMMMMTNGFGFGVNYSKKEEDYCYRKTNSNNTNNGSNNNYNSNSNINSNFNSNRDEKYTQNKTNIISYECSSLFEDYDDVMFPSDTIITVD